MLTKVKSKVVKKKVKFTKFKPQVRSKHPSHKGFREGLGLLPFRSIVRLGSTTSKGDEISKGGSRIECNTVEAIKNSSSKKLMKECFSRNNIKTAEWANASSYNLHNEDTVRVKHPNTGEEIFIEYPIVAKSHFGSRNEGNTFIANPTDMDNWLSTHKTKLTNYIFERYYNYVREYRLHVDSEGCFYTCRKMLKSDTPDDKKWFKNDSNCSWFMENNEKFDKPVNWSDIEQECIKALNSLGLDVAAFDVRVQSAKTPKGKIRENPDFIIIESGSAPSFGEVTQAKYLIQVPKILTRKYNILKSK